MWTLINEYTDWSHPAEHPINLLDSTVDILGDALVVSPLLETAELFAKSFLRRELELSSFPRSADYALAYRDREQSMKNRVYFYVFQNQHDQDPAIGSDPAVAAAAAAARSNIHQRLGSMHGELLDYLFGAPIALQVMGHTIGHFRGDMTCATDVVLSQAIINYITNFAKHG